MATFTNRVLWWVFVASLFMYALTAHLYSVKVDRPVGPTAPIPLLTAMFAGLSIVIAAGTIALRRRALAGPIQAGVLDPSTEDGLQKAYPVWLLTIALSESVGIYGFVLSLLSGRTYYVLAFGAAALALLYVHRPMAPDLVPPASSSVLGNRPPPIA